MAVARRRTITVVVVCVVAVALVLVLFVPMPGSTKGVTRSGLSAHLDRVHLDADAVVSEERYVGTDQCRIYQALTLSCEDSNFLERTIEMHQPAEAVCERIIDGQLDLGGPPDWHATGQQPGEPTCYFRYDLSPTVSVGGRVAPSGADGSTLFLNASSSGLSE